MERTRRGLSRKNRSSANSVAVRSTIVPARETSWRPSSSTTSPKREHVAGRVALGAPQDRADPGDDLGEAERLRHVVVAAGAQRLDLVLDGVLRRQEEDRRPEALRAQPAPDLDALEVGQHPVEHDQVGLGVGDRRQRRPAGGRLVDLEALVAKRRRHRVDDRRLVVDDQNAAALFAHPQNLASGSWELPVKLKTARPPPPTRPEPAGPR